MRTLIEAPTVDETAAVIARTLGKWTDVIAQVTRRAVTFDDCSCIADGANVVWSTIVKFCGIAEGARIKPGNHAT